MKRVLLWRTGAEQSIVVDDPLGIPSVLPAQRVDLNVPNSPFAGVASTQSWFLSARSASEKTLTVRGAISCRDAHWILGELAVLVCCANSVVQVSVPQIRKVG